MIFSRRTMLGSFAGLLTLGASPTLAGSDPLAGLDTDGDATVDLAEAKKAGGELFDKLDHDKDGTLDPKELRGKLSKAGLEKADLDKDGTLTKDEYLALVEQRFKVADTDGDGTLTKKELQTKAGRALVSLLR
jgi:Ca2+-binding EF-hand superfamily protein